MRPPITLRPVTPDDEPFLYTVYAGTREDELKPLDWDDAQKDSFLRMQFSAQHASYQKQFPKADFDIILLADKPIGRLYVDRRDEEIRIVDIAILPEHRNAGIGSALLDDVLTESAAASRPVRIHVEQFNPALHLYKRLGFKHIGDNGLYYLMQCLPTEPR